MIHCGALVIALSDPISSGLSSAPTPSHPAWPFDIFFLWQACENQLIDDSWHMYVNKVWFADEP